MALPREQPPINIREDLRKLSLEERLRGLGISLEPPTPAVLERTRKAAGQIRAWADRIGPIGVSAEELLRNEWDERTNG